MKVVINKCFGGFDLSDQAIETLADLKGIELYKSGKEYYTEYYTDPELQECFNEDTYPRYDEDLVKVIETLKEAANTPYSDLKVVEIPNGVNYYVDDYDGMETIRETHRTWS